MSEYVERLLLDLRDNIMAKQEDYRDLVKKFYEAKEPFKNVRPETESSFVEELRLLVEMVAHCIVIGDAEILYTYAIELIKANPERLSSFNNIDSYISALNEKYQTSQSDGEKTYLSYLISEFQLIAGGSAVA